MSKREIPETTDAKLAEIIEHLRRIDRRDRLRSWGGFVKGIISILPIILFLWGSWYLYKNGDEVLSKIAAEAAKQAAEVTQKNAESMLQRIQNIAQ